MEKEKMIVCSIRSIGGNRFMLEDPIMRKIFGIVDDIKGKRFRLHLDEITFSIIRRGTVNYDFLDKIKKHLIKEGCKVAITAIEYKEIKVGYYYNWGEV